MKQVLLSLRWSLLGSWLFSRGCFLDWSRSRFFSCKCVSNLCEKSNIRRYSSRSWCWFFYCFIDKTYKDKYREGNNHKIKCSLEKLSVRNHSRSNSSDFWSGIGKLTKVHTFCKNSKYWSKNISNERRYNLSKCSTNNNSDREVNYVSFHSEFFKIFEKSHTKK